MYISWANGEDPICTHVCVYLHKSCTNLKASKHTTLSTAGVTGKAALHIISVVGTQIALDFSSVTTVVLDTESLDAILYVIVAFLGSPGEGCCGYIKTKSGTRYPEGMTHEIGQHWEFGVLFSSLWINARKSIRDRRRLKNLILFDKAKIFDFFRTFSEKIVSNVST